jgi:P-type Cu+ transporter
MLRRRSSRCRARILPWSTRIGRVVEEMMMAIEIDPVCGMEVDTATSELSLEHDGTTYWFCGRGCLLEFKDDPAAYLPAGDQPTT